MDKATKLHRFYVILKYYVILPLKTIPIVIKIDVLRKYNNIVFIGLIPLLLILNWVTYNEYNSQFNPLNKINNLHKKKYCPSHNPKKRDTSIWIKFN